MFINLKDFTIRLLIAPALFALACLLTASVALAQETENAPTQDAKTEVAQVNEAKGNEAATAKPLQPKWTDYKGITIGMSAEEVRNKLDHLKDKGKMQDFFVFSETETAQVFYDAEGKVRAIAITYLNDKNAPDAGTIFGEKVEPQANGSIYKLVRYEDAGYWVSYNRTAGDVKLVTVTIQKI